MYFEIYKERKQVFGGSQETGRWRWRVRAQNGNILADSGQGYAGGRSAVIKSIKKFCEHIRGDGFVKVKDMSCGQELMF